MRKLAFALIATICLSLFVGLTSAIEPDASIRYLTVESITYEPDYPFHWFNPTPIPCTHFSYTFAMWKVNAWADRCYYVATVQRDKIEVVVAKWSVGFGVSPITGKIGLQGIYIDYSTDLLTVHTVMAEFPYNSEVMENAIDGTQTYQFFRMHFYFKGELFKTEEVTVAADYMKQPVTSATPTFSTSTRATSVSLTGDEVTYRIIKTNPSDFKFKEVKK